MAKCDGSYMYLLKEREFLNSGEDVVKAGFSEAFSKRMLAYPKGSIVLATLRVSHGRSTERKVLAVLRSRFKSRRDIGAEYFEGPLCEIVSVFQETCNADVSDVVTKAEPSTVDVGDEDDTEDEEEGEAEELEVSMRPDMRRIKKMVDLNVAVPKFVGDTLHASRGRELQVAEVYASFLEYIDAADWMVKNKHCKDFVKVASYLHGATSLISNGDRTITFPSKDEDTNVFAVKSTCKSTVAAFVKKNIAKSNARHSPVTLVESYAAYVDHCTKEGKAQERKCDFKEELVAILGPFSPPSKGQRNFWRGWILA